MQVELLKRNKNDEIDTLEQCIWAAWEINEEPHVPRQVNLQTANWVIQVTKIKTDLRMLLSCRRRGGVVDESGAGWFSDRRDGGRRDTRGFSQIRGY